MHDFMSPASMHQRGPCLAAGITLHTYNWLHIPSKAHHHSPGPTAWPTLTCLWLTAFPMKGPPVGPYTPHSRTDPYVLKGDCISEEKPTSVDEALQPLACPWWSASPKRSTSVVQALNPCRPPNFMGQPSLRKKKKLAWTMLSCHENHCVPACRLHLQRKAHYAL